MDVQKMEIRDVIEFALEREVMARRLYEQLASRTRQDDARMMFLELVTFEAEHVRIFARALSAEIKRLGFDVPSFLEKAEAKTFTMPGILDNQTLNTGALADVLPAAKSFEKGMAAFYTQVAGHSALPQVKEACLRLSAEEMSHYDYVVRIEEVMKLSPEFDDGEFHPQ